MSTLKYWLWLSECKGVSARTMNALLDAFGSPEAVYFAREHEPRAAVPRMTAAETDALQYKSMERPEQIIADCSRLGCSIITIADAAYPERLRSTATPPIVLYVSGNLPVVDDEAAVAIVGTRRCTPYGLKTASKIAFEIAQIGGVVVTGLARGIDSAAANGALRAGGTVIGVLGSGLDVVYPPENRELFNKVKTHGALVSEYPPGTQPLRTNFPARNRIMSGLSLGVVVTEAPRRSGSLITAMQALEEGRDVFAVPGNVDAPSFEGSNELLRDGAIPVRDGRDVMNEYMALFPDKLGGSRRTAADADEKPAEAAGFGETAPVSSSKIAIDNDDGGEYIDFIDLKEKPDDMTDSEYAVALALCGGARGTDDIVARCGLSAADVMSSLTMLEINGYVERAHGKGFILKRK